MIRAGPTHVPLLAVGDLGGLAVRYAIRVQIEVPVAIRIEIDRVAHPDRITRGSRPFGDSLGVIGLQIKDIEDVGLAAAVSLLRPEVSELRRVNHPGVVGRIITRSGFGHRQRFSRTTVHRHAIEPRNRQRP